jgi:multicomponent Na+:H+ antiporter subunit E
MRAAGKLSPSIRRVVSLSGALMLFWWLLSGYASPLLLGLGAASTLLVIALALRMEVIDHDSHPVGLSRALLSYWVWLLKEVVVTNVQLARLILQRDPQLSPTQVCVPTTKRSDVGLVTFANSITLTPGTLSLAVHADSIDVLALTRDGADDLLTGEMERRVPDCWARR